MKKKKRAWQKKKTGTECLQCSSTTLAKSYDTTEWYTEGGTHERVKNTAGDATEGTGSHMHRPAGFMRGRGGRLFVH